MDTQVRYRSVGWVMLAAAAVVAAVVAGAPVAGSSPGGARRDAVEGAAQARCVDPPGDMLGWWTFDELESIEPAGEAFRDRAGAVNNAGVPVEGFTKVEGEYAGNSIALNGGAQFVEVQDDPELSFGTESFAIDAWVYLEADSKGSRTIVDKRTFSPGQGYWLYTADGQVAFQMADASARSDECSTDPDLSACTDFESGKVISEGEWHFVAVSVDRLGESFFYIDGEVVPFDATLRRRSLDNTAPLRIGGYVADSAFWHGRLDEVELYRRALKADDLAAIYHAGPAGKCKEPRPTTTHTPPVPMEIGGVEVVNVTVQNECGFDVDGFRFILSDFWPPAPINAANYGFVDIFEKPCPTNDPNCNPFVLNPPEATPTYSTANISLAWQNPSAPLVLHHLAHFGYTLGSGTSGIPLPSNASHKITGQLMSTTGSPASCVAVGSSSTWTKDNSNVVLIKTSNHRDESMYLRLSVTTSQDPVVLGDLVSSNDQLMRRLGTPVASAILKPGEELPVAIQVTQDDRAVVLLADWYGYDTEPRALEARVFHARPVGTMAVQPTVSPASTVTPTLTPTPLRTETSTVTPSSTSTHSPTSTEPPASPTSTWTSSPTETPTPSRTPLPRTWIYLPSVGNWLSPGVIRRSGAH